MHGLVFCIKVDSYEINYVLCMVIDKNNSFIPLKTNTTVFSWGAVNSNKNIT